MGKYEVKSEYILETKNAINNLNNLSVALSKATRYQKLLGDFSKVYNLKNIDKVLDSRRIDNMAKNIVNQKLINKQVEKERQEKDKLMRQQRKVQAEMDRFYRQLDIAKKKENEADRKKWELVAKAKEHNKKMMETQIKANTKLKASYMGLGFAMLFGGMAIKRAFSSALKSMLNTYKEVMSENEEFLNTSNRLTGAWEFLKFALIDALMQSDLFRAILDGVISLINWLGQLSAKHPMLAGFVTTFIALGMALGWVAQVLGQVGLAYIAYGVAGSEANTAVSVTAKGVLLAMAKIVGILLIISAVVFIVYRIFKSKLDATSKILLNVGVVLLGLAGILTILKFTGVATWLAIGGGIFLLVGVIYAFKDTISNVFKWIWAYLKLGWENATYGIADAFYWAMDKALKLTKKVAETMDNVFGTHYTSKVQDAINNLALFRDAMETTHLQTAGIYEVEIYNLEHDISDSFNEEWGKLKSIWSPEGGVDTENFKKETGVNLGNKNEKESFKEQVEELKKNNDINKDIKDISQEQSFHLSNIYETLVNIKNTKMEPPAELKDYIPSSTGS